MNQRRLATIGDPNAGPPQRIGVCLAFIEQRIEFGGADHGGRQGAEARGPNGRYAEIEPITAIVQIMAGEPLRRVQRQK